MKISKHIVTLSTVAMLAGGVLAAGAASVNAQGLRNNNGGIIQRIAEHFGLDQSEVAGVFQEYRAQRQTEMAAKFTENLDQLLAAGKITEAQKQAILAKHEELQNNREDLINASPEDRRAAMQKNREQMQAWAQSQGLDLGQLRIGFGEMGPKGFGQRNMMKGR
jgi:flagellar biosynthesis GTPase FlhF